MDKPYKTKTGSCFYCEKTTNQYYVEDNQFICDECLFELEEDELTSIFLDELKEKFYNNLLDCDKIDDDDTFENIHGE